MSTKIIFLLATAFLLVQYSAGKPMPEDVKKDSSSSDSSEEDALEKLITTQFIQLIDKSLESGKKILEAVVDELSKTDDKSEDVTAVIDELSQVVSKLQKETDKDSKEESIAEKIELLALLEDLDEKYDTEGKENPEDKVVLVQKLLDKHGWNTTGDELEKLSLELLVKIAEAAEKYWNSLSSKEQENNEKFESWLKKFKEESDSDKKFDMIADEDLQRISGSNKED